MQKLIKLPEPTLLFRYGQAIEDPRDGLTLFGPLDKGRPYGIRAGVVGTKSCIERFKRWVDWLQLPVSHDPPRVARPPFPGFESAFRIPWDSEPILTLEVNEEELKAHLFLDDRHQRVFETVNIFAERITRALTEEEIKPDLWFVVIPDIVRKYCRPKAMIEPAVRQDAKRYFSSVKQAKSLYRAPSLFREENEAAEAYFYKEHFRNQLKARLLVHRISTQVVRESTIANIGKAGEEGVTKSQLALQSSIAWHLSTAAFYKSGGRPWKIAEIRGGVCYIGLVYKQDERDGDPKSACCAAQMFMDSGDGVVFKGAVGPWYTPESGDFHLNRESARELVALALKSYKDKRGEEPPREIFLHGQVKFSREEWRGFQEAVGSETNIVGVKIRNDASLKLFRKSDNPILRGTAWIRDKKSAFLWTKGWIPRMQTYPGREVPNPLTVEICQGDASIKTVLADILALTKLNYNACIFSDGKPITLKFADAVGEVLTAGPIRDIPPLPFQYYI